VTVDTRTGTVRYNYDFYALGHASKFIRPGARRIASTTFGSGSIQDVAVRNPDGSKAVVVLNSDATARTFKIRRGRESFTYQLPAGAVASFTWPDSPPTVAITSPAANATVSGVVTIAAQADSSAGVQRVDFLVDGQLLATDTTAPYQASWSSVAGSHTLAARVTDAAGVTATSAVVPVTAVANQPPVITLTSPADGSTFTSPATVTIAATATDSDGTVTRVDFYNGSTLLASDSTPPFTTKWKVGATGTYLLSAAAVDSSGATTQTPAVRVTITRKR
jgi:hypothetical protein